MARTKQAAGDDGYRDPIAELTHPKQRAFLEVYKNCCNLVKSARAVGINRDQHYYWLNTNTDYARAFASAKQEAGDILESEAMRRATEGVEKQQYYKGKPMRDAEGNPAIVRDYSDTLLIFLMKGHMPEKYRDNFQAPTGDDDGARIAGRSRAEIIAEEIAVRQKALEMIRQSEVARGN